MRILPKRWARQFLFSSGPKSGSPSKALVDAISLQGTQPGSGTRIAAEEMNELLALYSEHVEYQRFQGLSTWRAAAAGANAAVACVQHPFTGELWFSGQTNDVRIAPGTCESIGTIATAFSTLTSRAATRRKDTAGNGSIVIFGNYATGIRARYTAAGAPTVLSSADLAVGSAVSARCAAYDDVGAVALAFTTESNPRIVRMLDSGTSLAFAGSAPTFDPVNASNDAAQLLACGGGRALLVYGGSYSGGTVTNFTAYTSTNAGNTWTSTTAPPGSTSAVLHDLRYVEDFLGLGPKFVCVTSSTSGGRALHHTTDGSVWTTIAAPAHVNSSTTAGSPAVVIGNTVIYAAGTADPYLLVWDVGRGNVTRYCHSTIGFSHIWLAGGRLVGKQSSGGNVNVLSGQIIAPLTFNLGRLSD